MLWAALLGEEVVLVEKPPELVDDEQARPEELAEVPRLGRRGSGGLGLSTTPPAIRTQQFFVCLVRWLKYLFIGQNRG